MNRLKLELKTSTEVDWECGTKASTLAKLKKLGVDVPEFWVIPSVCFEYFCYCIKIPNPISFYSRSQFDPIVSEMFDNYDILNEDTLIENFKEGRYMVRSSAVPTKIVDLELFPSMISGAFESYDVSSLAEIANNILRVWRSVYEAKAFYQCRILSEQPIIEGMAVIIQKYIRPIISGVAHTRGKGVSVNWIQGHLSQIVNGKNIGNTIEIYKNLECEYILRGIEQEILIIKENEFENVFKYLFDKAMVIKKYFEHEQEIEWIYDGDKIWIVQTQSLILD